MAEIVFGVACSHSPQLSMPVEAWPVYADRDRRKTDLVGLDGGIYSYDELRANAPKELAAQLTDDVCIAKYERMQKALDTCRDALAGSGATVAVVVGNDHKELFGDDGMPAFAVYLGEAVQDNPASPEALSAMPTVLRQAWRAYHGDVTVNYAVATELAWQIAEHVTNAGFDLGQLTRQPPGRTLGHAWTYSCRRLMNDPPLPIVPVFLNSLYPPTQPTPSRCYEFGRAVAMAVQAWDSDERVAIVTTGGLSHFVVDVELDQTVLKALADHDGATLGSLDRRKMNSGTSEILNWVTAGGALRGLSMDLIDYVPAYRSEAGTGVGMGFALWR